MVRGTVAIVTHNSAEHIARCLRALIPCQAWKVVLVDNNSQDDSVRAARAVLPEAQILVNSHNAGFAAAVNQAMKVAEGEVLVILNPDTIASPGSLDHLVRTLRMDGVGAVGGLLVDEEGRPQKGFTVRRFPTMGNMLAEILLLNRAWPGNRWNVSYRCLDLDYKTLQEVEQPAGACLAVRREVWQAVNGFDESFFPVWFEDVDFCRRLRYGGWKIIYCPDAVFTHVGAHSVGKLPFAGRQAFWYRNLLRFFRKHHKRVEVAVLRAGITAGLLLRAILSLAGFRPANTTVSQCVGAYCQIAWHYGLRGKDV